MSVIHIKANGDARQVFHLVRSAIDGELSGWSWVYSWRRNGYFRSSRNTASLPRSSLRR